MVPPVLVDTCAVHGLKKAKLPYYAIAQSPAGVTPQENLKSPLHTGFETQGRHHKKCKIGVSVVPQKEMRALKRWRDEDYVQINTVSVGTMCRITTCSLQSRYA